MGEGLVGLAVQDRRAVLVNDLELDPNYKGYVPGMRSSIVVPLVYRTRTIGALNILSAHRHAFTEKDLAIVRQFGVHAATALENARLYTQAAKDAKVFETLLEISREISSILDIDLLFERLAAATLKVIDYKAFAILLLNPQTQRLDVKHLATPYGINEKVTSIAVGDGLTGYAALHREVVVSGNVHEDSRYIELFDTDHVRDGGAAALSGRLHRRARPQHRRARRLRRRRGGVRHAARRPVRDRDPERASLPGTGDQPVAHRARAAARAARADGAVAAGGPERDPRPRHRRTVRCRA